MFKLIKKRLNRKRKIYLIDKAVDKSSKYETLLIIDRSYDLELIEKQLRKHAKKLEMFPFQMKLYVSYADIEPNEKIKEAKPTHVVVDVRYDVIHEDWQTLMTGATNLWYTQETFEKIVSKN